MNRPFPDPRVFRVAVIGRRNLSAEDHRVAEEALGSLFDKIRAAVHKTLSLTALETTPSPRMVVVTALARGVDQIGARLAAERGVRGDAVQMRSGWLESQLAYHEKTAGRFHRAPERGERLNVVLFWAALGAVASGVLVGIAKWLHFGSIPTWASLTLLFLAVASPTLAGSLHALMIQSELERLAERSAAMQRAIRPWVDPTVNEPGSLLIEECEDLATLRRRTEEISERLLGEATDWLVFYRAHEVPRT